MDYFHEKAILSFQAGLLHTFHITQLRQIPSQVSVQKVCYRSIGLTEIILGLSHCN